MEKTVRLTTAQALLKFLNQQYISVDGKETPYVEGFFHVYGHGNVLGIGQALEQEPGHLKSYSGKNEQGMAHAATAFARQNLRKKIFAVSTSAGPGAANLLTAAGTAFANNIPVLFLPADTFATRQPDPVLQQLEHAASVAFSTNDAFQAVSRYWDRINRPEQLMSALLRAFEVMTNPATMGPATICLPQDVEAEAYDYPEEFFKKRVHYFDRRIPTARELDAASQQIKDSKRPVIIVGGGCKYSEAGEILEQISRDCQIPLVETHAGKSTVSWNFKNNLGGMGILGTSAANKAVQQADLIIGIGTRYTDFTSASKSIFNFEQAKMMNINVSRQQAAKLEAFQVVGDAKATLEQLAPMIEGYQTTYGEKINELKEEWLSERNRLKYTHFTREAFTPEIKDHFSQEILNEYADALATNLTQTEVFIHLNDFVDEDAIVIGSAGSLPGDMQRLWNPMKENTYHLEYGYSCMGYEIAGAMGVRMAQPEQEVYALVGDGSFLMLHSELVSSLQYDKKINIVLFDNSGFGCINNLQMDNGGASQGTEFRNTEDEIMNIDYAKIAEGYGAKAYRVSSIEELQAAVEDAKKQTRSTLIEVKVLPKTMTDGYDGSWWNVGIAEVSEKAAVQEAYKAKQAKLAAIRKY
ncbi:MULTISPECIES: 3D-(3,5/4)-trihydroxycyclohexane-1,2-dione acylhydrolase (decyclizing) [Enterococcus]|mgnify:CR=1 FL=1|uniref:3D-(3,5/4)-trihydroxycyclohexane-1,2-dione acylhydrolase (decyclizing) n=1 Tax=Enterococcus TaxID=1350 RepID=UPI0001CEB0A2|nr:MULTISPECIES: 3D-(3,5/4)-trihydroxycyclohexane-1,2-dione acylhydrolase (decyclizing) [Enterococcus]EFF24867.1 probable malonic semialdehyde oxidative decarboxylase [Enterococcus faecium E1679]MCH3472721.1 3D-(3,5/4)-trihydroxycyclohexane-1,2-dione acylhydrolase (decyclizing) [Enterococcus faecium]MCH3584375.1 3D-(3,5/4)-trihydroxycyclohexane-1,2-dione acylhydrolase (decyclizing) [Enterococcus faecium]OFT85664.1 3D-(3,5/4)-trihydroxycyclohexane-1,2-dione acylhydrolase (decyclizing) [Enterococ